MGYHLLDGYTLSLSQRCLAGARLLLTWEQSYGQRLVCRGRMAYSLVSQIPTLNTIEKIAEYSLLLRQAIQINKTCFSHIIKRITKYKMKPQVLT